MDVCASCVDTCGCVKLFEKRVAEESDIFIDKDYVHWLEIFRPALLYTQWSLPMQFTSLSFSMSAFYCYGLLFYCSTEPCDDYSRVSIYLSGMISIFHPSCSRCISVCAVGGHRFHYRCKVMLSCITHIYNNYDSQIQNHTVGPGNAIHVQYKKSIIGLLLSIQSHT